MAGREAIRYQLAAITYWYRQYFAEEQQMKHGKTDEARWAAYEARFKAEEEFCRFSQWFISQRVPLGYDEEKKEYFALTKPPLRMDMEAFLKVLHEKTSSGRGTPQQPDSADAR